MRWGENAKCFHFPRNSVTLAVETVECFGEKAEEVFPLPISKLTYKVPIKFFQSVLV